MNKLVVSLCLACSVHFLACGSSSNDDHVGPSSCSNTILISNEEGNVPPEEKPVFRHVPAIWANVSIDDIRNAEEYGISVHYYFHHLNRPRGIPLATQYLKEITNGESPQDASAELKENLLNSEQFWDTCEYLIKNDPSHISVDWVIAVWPEEEILPFGNRHAPGIFSYGGARLLSRMYAGYDSIYGSPYAVNLSMPAGKNMDPKEMGDLWNYFSTIKDDPGFGPCVEFNYFCAFMDLDPTPSASWFYDEKILKVKKDFDKWEAALKWLAVLDAKILRQFDNEQYLEIRHDTFEGKRKIDPDMYGPIGD